MAFDPFLYVAFGVGLLAQLAVRRRPGWVPSVTVATVVVLVGLLGASLASVALDALVRTIPLALALAAALLAFTAVVYLGLVGRTPAPSAENVRTERDRRLPLSATLLAALVVGFALARVVSFPASSALPFALYALLALVGFDLRFRVGDLRTVWAPIAAASVAALAVAGALAAVTGISLRVSLATTLAFGWYTLAGPLVAARAGAVLGLLAFLTNFLRENLTMLFAPYVGRRLRGGGIAALGGATSMDTTLYFATRYGDPDAGSVALATGLVFTVAASLLLPLVLLLPV